MIGNLTKEQKNLISGDLFKKEAEKHNKDVIRVSLDTDLEVGYLRDLYQGYAPVTEKALTAFTKLYGKHVREFVDFSEDNKRIVESDLAELKSKTSHNSKEGLQKIS